LTQSGPDCPAILGRRGRSWEFKGRPGDFARKPRAQENSTLDQNYVELLIGDANDEGSISGDVVRN
jgi:hypothetical protein